MRWRLDGVVDASMNAFLDLVSSGVTFVLTDGESVPLAFGEWVNFWHVASFNRWSFDTVRQFAGARVLHASFFSALTAFTCWIYNFDVFGNWSHTA